jgi:hypothetical protein
LGLALEGALVIFRRKHGERGKFGHPVELHQSAPKRGGGGAQGPLGCGRSAVHQQTKIAVGAAGRAGDLQAGVDHRRHQRRHVDAVFIQQPDDFGGIEFAHDSEFARDGQPCLRQRHGKNVEHRNRDQQSFARPRLDHLQAACDASRKAVARQLGAFRKSGGAAGIHLKETCIARQLSRGKWRGLALHPIRERLPVVRPARPQAHAGVQARQLGTQRIDQTGKFLSRDQYLGRAVFEDEGDFRRGEARVHEHADRADLGTGRVESKVLQAVAGQYGNAATRHDAARLEAAAQVVHPGAQFPSGKPSVTVYGNGVAWSAQRQSVDDFVKQGNSRATSS